MTTERSRVPLILTLPHHQCVRFSEINLRFPCTVQAAGYLSLLLQADIQSTRSKADLVESRATL